MNDNETWVFPFEPPEEETMQCPHCLGAVPVDHECPYKPEDDEEWPGTLGHI